MKLKDEMPLYLAELIGSFFLVFFGCGSVVLAEVSQYEFESSFIPLVFGGVVSVMIYSVGHISGAHFNPAVTIAFWSIKRFPLNRVLGYISAQVIGAILASSIHLLIFGNEHSFGVTEINLTLLGSVIVEFILSFLLMFVITSVATDSRAVGEMAGMAVGLTVALGAFFGGPLTGASMNPARSLGPAIVSGNLNLIILYLFVPILGAVLGARVYEWIRCQRGIESDSQGCC